MAIRTLTDGTGKRMALAMEGIAGLDNGSAIKIPHIDSFDFATLVNFAQNHGHSANQEIAAIPFATTTTANSPLLNFLKGLSTLSDFETADEGRVAYCSYSFMKFLLFEASRFNQNAIVKTTDGLVTKIDNCTLKEVSNEYLPFDFSFLILGGEIVKGLNELESQGLLDDAEALNVLLEANSDSLYCHLGSFELNVLPISVTPGSAGKIIVKVRRDKMISTDKWFYKTAENFESLPAVVYNTSVDVTTSSSAWHGGIELQDAQAIDPNTWEITPTSGHTAIRIVEVKRNMKPFAVNSKSFAIGE